jgi:hypothetical protein
VKKGTRNYLIFLALVLLALLQTVSGFILWLVLPSGDGYRGGAGVIGENSFVWDRHIWLDLHDWTAVILVVMVIIHLVLHWRWITYMTKKFLKGDV